MMNYRTTLQPQRRPPPSAMINHRTTLQPQRLPPPSAVVPAVARVRGKTVTDLPQEVLHGIARELSLDDARSFLLANSQLRKAGESRCWRDLRLHAEGSRNQRDEGAESLRDLFESMIHLVGAYPPRAAFIKTLSIDWPQEDLKFDDYHCDQHPKWSGVGTRTQVRWEILLRAMPLLPSCHTLEVITCNPRIFDHLALILPKLPSVRHFEMHHQASLAWAECTSLAPPVFPETARLIETVYFRLGDPRQVEHLGTLLEWVGMSLTKLSVSQFVRAEQGEQTLQLVRDKLRKLDGHLVKLRCLDIELDAYPGDGFGETIEDLRLSNTDLMYKGVLECLARGIARGPNIKKVSIVNERADAPTPTTPCAHTIPIEAEMVTRLLAAPRLLTMRSEMSCGDAQELRIRQFNGPSATLWHLQIAHSIDDVLPSDHDSALDEDSPPEPIVRDYTEYQGQTVPLNTLQKVYEQAGLSLAEFEASREMILSSETSEILDRYVEGLEGEDDLAWCGQCGGEP